MGNLKFTQDFTSLQNENEKTVSGLGAVASAVHESAVGYVCIVGLQHKVEWMNFLTELST